MLNVFISGLQRSSGKTLIGAGLAATMQSLSYSTVFYKPIQTGAKMLSGFKCSPDLAYVKRIDSNIVTCSTYALSSEASPFVGAYEEGVKLGLNTIVSDYTANRINDCNIVEGSNSVSCPVAQDITEVDIAKNLGLPILLVVNPKYSSVADVLSGIAYIKSKNVEFIGVIVNQYDENSGLLEEKYFPQILKEFTDVKILGVLPNYKDIATLTPESLIEDILNYVDIEEVFGLKIAKLNS